MTRPKPPQSHPRQGRGRLCTQGPSRSAPPPPFAPPPRPLPGASALRLALLACLLGLAAPSLAGQGLGPDFIVPEAPSRTADDQVEPTLIQDPNALLFAAWVDTGRSPADPNNENLWLRAFLPSGLARGNSVLASSDLVGQARTPHLALFSGGKMLLTWQDASASRIMVRLFTSGLMADTPFISETFISAAGPVASAPRAAIRDTGNLAVVAWLEGTAVKFNRLDIGQGTASAARLDGTGGANASVSGTPGSPDVAGAGSGQFVLAYRSNSSGQKIFAMRRNSDGSINGSELEVASGSVVSSSSRPRIAALGSSRFALVWNGPGPGGQDDVFGQLLGLGGSGLTLVGARFTVNTLTAGTQTLPSVVSPSTRDGGTPDRFLVTWQDCLGGASCSDFDSDPQGFDGDRSGIAAQLFEVVSGAAQKLGPFFTLNTTVEGLQANAAAAMDASGRWAAAWEDLEADGDGTGVLARRFDSSTLSLPDTRAFEFNVNQDGAAPPTIREGASLDSDDSGVVTIVWEDDNAGASSKAVYLARLSPAGRRLPLDSNDPNSIELRLSDPNDPNTVKNLRPQVAVEPASGRGVVAWVRDTGVADSASIRYRQFTIGPGGQLLLQPQQTVAGSVVLNTSISNSNALLDVAVNRAPDWPTNGRFAITWEGKSVTGSDTDIFARVYRGNDSPPAPDPGLITVNNLIGPGNQRDPSMGMSAVGTWTVLFKRTGATAGLATRRFTLDGVALTDEVRLDTLGYDDTAQQYISVNGPGKALVVWRGMLTGAVNAELYGRWLDSNGIPLGATETQLSSASGLLEDPVCDLSDNDESILVWWKQTDLKLYFLRFSPERNPRGPESSFYTNSAFGRIYPAVTTSADGDTFVVYHGIQPTTQGGSSATNENNDLFLTRLTPEPPAASFSSTLPACSGSPTGFTDTSATEAFTSVAGWKWDLSHDAASFVPDSTAQHPSTTYPNVADTLDVLLRVVDDRIVGRTGFALMPVNTAALPARPVPSFGSTSNADRTVDFSGCASCGGHGAPFRYDWAFGDGAELLDSTDASPSHLYSQSGAYTAALTVRDTLGCQSTAPSTSSVEVLPILATLLATTEDPVAGVGDTVDIELAGDPNRVAKATLSSSARALPAIVPLTETPPGSGAYLGSYTVQAGDGQSATSVVGTLSEPGDVRLVSRNATGPPVDTVAPAIPLITKNVGLGPGQNYTTANPAISLPGTTSSDTEQLTSGGLGNALLSYTPGQTAFTLTGTLGEGANAINLQARDLAENISAPGSITVTLDQVAPVTLHDRLSGGTIRNVDADPAAVVFFPPNTLRQPTPYAPAQLSLSKLATPGGIPLGPGVAKVGLFGWELLPSESFDSLATVTLRYSDGDIIGLDEAELTIAYRDQTLNQWRQDGVFIESLDAAQNTIVFKTTHFTFFTFAQGDQPLPPTATPTVPSPTATPTGPSPTPTPTSSTPTPPSLSSYPARDSSGLPAVLALLLLLGTLGLRRRRS